MRGILLFLLISITMSAQNSFADCDRTERIVDYTGRPFQVFVSKDHWAEVIFPAPISGMLDENPTGLYVQNSGGNNLPDRIFLRVESNDYQGKILVHDTHGKSYHFFAVGTDCADSSISVVNHLEKNSGNNNASDQENSSSPNTGSKSRRKLIEYMMTNAKPPGYRVEKLKGPRHERLIGSQGSVHFYVEEIYRGRNYSGVVLLAENNGRVPFKIALQTIDFQSPEIKEVFGRVFEVSMLPADFTLGPAPEYAVDIYGTRHQGLIFIVSKQVRKFSGR